MTTRAWASDQKLLMLRRSSRMRELNDSTKPLRHGAPRSPAGVSGRPAAREAGRRRRWSSAPQGRAARSALRGHPEVSQRGQQRVEIRARTQGELTRTATRVEVCEQQLIALTWHGPAPGAFPARDTALQAGQLGTRHSRHAQPLGNSTQRTSLIGPRPSPLLAKPAQQPAARSLIVGIRSGRSTEVCLVLLHSGWCTRSRCADHRRAGNR